MTAPNPTKYWTAWSQGLSLKHHKGYLRQQTAHICKGMNFSTSHLTQSISYSILCNIGMSGEGVCDATFRQINLF